jgi:hypothetical protein
MPKITRAKSWALLALPLALAACNKGPSVEAKNETPQAVASKVAASGLRMSPGRWEASTEVEKFDMPGMTPEMRDMMKKNLKKTAFAACLTPEQAAKPNAGFFESKNNDCKFDNFSMAGGKIDATMTCAQAGVKQTMKMSGDYTPDSYKIHMEMNGSTQGQAMSMAMTTAAKRVGACKGNEGS